MIEGPTSQQDEPTQDDHKEIPRPEASSTTPSTLKTLLQRPPTRSTMSSLLVSGIRYPKPPKPEIAPGLKTCEWCAETYKTAQFDDSRWWTICPICSYKVENNENTHNGTPLGTEAQIYHPVVTSTKDVENKKLKGKQVKFGTPLTPSPLVSQIKNDLGIDNRSFQHKLSQTVLQQQTVRHIAEHLLGLAFLAVRLKSLDEQQPGDVLLNDDTVSDQVTNSSTEGQAIASEIPRSPESGEIDSSYMDVSRRPWGEHFAGTTMPDDGEFYNNDEHGPALGSAVWADTSERGLH
ncbi:hypothetical protein SUNI508_00859 [Seiridium unicorne]|uniref:Uncharacterized protein n=1 Tax=Seiridium unicorne TaxID=138068 RepID=A0ABR2V1H0_9PEZI